MWYPAQFADLRHMILARSGDEAAYVASLSRCRPWDAQGGKSKSTFIKTRDDRFIVKTLSAAEKRSFQVWSSNVLIQLLKQHHWSCTFRTCKGWLVQGILPMNALA